MKRLTGRKVYRKEGQTERLFSEIECTCCGAITYARRSTRIKAYLEKDCVVCKVGYKPEPRQGKSHARKRAPEKHGMWRTPTYRSWEMMIQRCTNPDATSYENYGGRGVTVCDRWLHSFKNFYEDMGERPEGTTLDKDSIKEGNLVYCKEFCTWLSVSEQNKHQRPRK